MWHLEGSRTRKGLEPGMQMKPSPFCFELPVFGLRLAGEGGSGGGVHGKVLKFQK